MQTFFKSKFKAITTVFFVVAIGFASCSESNNNGSQETLSITAFSFENQAKEAQIDSDGRSIKIDAQCGTNLAEIVPEFTLSPEGATVKIKGIRQVSGKSAVDFSEEPSVIYTLTTADGKTTVEWEVNVAPAAECLPNWTVNLQKRNRNGTVEKFTEKWRPEETAIVVIDMWSKQTWEGCNHNSLREIDMSLAMNGVFDVAREKGMLIVFAPSTDAEEFEKWYGHLPARRTSEKYRRGYGNPRHWDYWWHGRGGEREHSGLAFPGENDSPGWYLPGSPDCMNTSKMDEPQPPQIVELRIDDRDIITDDFVEMMGGRVDGWEYEDCLFKERGIKNVIVAGCHTDICVVGRPFGCRGLVMAGYNTVLCRDLTNSTYNCSNRVQGGPSHVEGTAIICDYVETYICPSITSTEITGEPAFAFDEEKVLRIYPPFK